MIHYMTPMLGTATRRSKIRKNWFFDCSCPRCSDPTELNTFASALLCPVCVKGGCEGILLPKEPLNPACIWTCSLPGCSSHTESSIVSNMVANFEKDLDAVGESVEDLETLLVTLGQTLHPQHYLMMTGKRRLLASLHISSSQQGRPPSRLLLQHIVDLADESLRVFGVLDPGPTVLKGRMLQYRNGPKMILAKMDLQEDKISKAEFLAETAAAMRNVKLASKCFETSDT